jgi:hypothetical protein
VLPLFFSPLSKPNSSCPFQKVYAPRKVSPRGGVHLELRSELLRRVRSGSAGWEEEEVSEAVAVKEPLKAAIVDTLFVLGIPSALPLLDLRRFFYASRLHESYPSAHVLLRAEVSPCVALENLALQHQLDVLRRNAKRPRFTN